VAVNGPAADGAWLPSGLTWQAHGHGAPVTLVVPGLGATPGEARIPASGLPGTRVVLTLPSHGHAPDAEPGYWRYPRLAAEVAAVADRVGATRAVGVSLGAGALTRLVAEQPDRFERLALLLPAALDGPRSPTASRRLHHLATAVDQALDHGDDTALRDLVTAEVPAGVAVGDHVSARTQALLRLRDALHELPGQSPLGDLGRAADVLAGVQAKVLVIGATRDPLHPREVAEAVADAIGGAELELFDSPAPLLTHRAQVRERLRSFLA